LQVKTYEELTKDELLQILQLRQKIFIIEQNSLFSDIDGNDRNSIHIFSTHDQEIKQYCRVFIGNEITLGRVLVNPKYRGNGSGRELLDYAIQYIQKNYPKNKIHISAMVYLEKFYTSLGFIKKSNPYEVANHMHIDMTL